MLRLGYGFSPELRRHLGGGPASTVPHRPSVPRRLVVLAVAVAAHAVLAQLLYAGWLVDVPGPAADRMAGAQLMYWFGDLAEVALALAVLSRWRPDPRPAPVAA